MMLRWNHPRFRTKGIRFMEGPKSNVCHPYKRGGRNIQNTDSERKTHRWRPCEVRSREWSDESTSQRTPRLANNHQKIREWHGTDSSPEHPEGINPEDTLILNFCLQNYDRIKLLWFEDTELVVICSSSSSKWTQ